MENGLQKVLVCVDVATLVMSAHGSITGVISIRTADRCFPSPDWNDFPVVILGWWLDPLSRILDGKANIWECRFMDGPLTMRLVQREGDSWLMTGTHNGRIELKATVSCRAFIQSLLGAAREVLTTCVERGWKNRDIDNLASALKRIELEVS